MALEVYACGADADCAAPVGPVATATVPLDGNPVHLPLREGWYQVRGTVVYDSTCGDEGCSPGFWKNHLELWGSYLSPDQSEQIAQVIAGQPSELILTGTPLAEASPGEVFGVSVAGATTLYEAISLGGGGTEKLARHGVAALLNARSTVLYPYTEAEVIAMVEAGMADDDTPGEPEATVLAAANNLGCPLD